MTARELLIADVEPTGREPAATEAVGLHFKPEELDSVLKRLKRTGIPFVSTAAVSRFVRKAKPMPTGLSAGPLKKVGKYWPKCNRTAWCVGSGDSRCT